MRRVRRENWRVGRARGGCGRRLCIGAAAAMIAAASPATIAQEVAGPPARAAMDTPPPPERRSIGHPDTPARESAPLGGVQAAPGAPAPAGGGLGAARTILSLGVVLGLAVAAAAVAKRLARAQGGLAAGVGAGGAAPAGIMEIIGRYPIARGQKLVLLRLDRRILLLSHVAPSRLSRGGGFSTLCEITDPDDVASILTKGRDADGESLAAKFQSLLGRYGHDGADGADEHEDAAAEPPELRTVKLGPEDDRAELWDDAPMRLVPDAGRQCGETDAVSAIRRRLEAMRGGATGAGGRA